jgi:hypothetical protein
MSPSDPTTPEVRPAPSVEQRLGYALAAMECLQQIAAIADEPYAIPLFNDLRTFAAFAAQFSWVSGIRTGKASALCVRGATQALQWIGAS